MEAPAFFVYHLSLQKILVRVGRMTHVPSCGNLSFFLNWSSINCFSLSSLSPITYPPFVFGCLFSSKGDVALLLLAFSLSCAFDIALISLLLSDLEITSRLTRTAPLPEHECWKSGDKIFSS